MIATRAFEALRASGSRPEAIHNYHAALQVGIDEYDQTMGELDNAVMLGIDISDTRAVRGFRADLTNVLTEWPMGNQPGSLGMVIGSLAALRQRLQGKSPEPNGTTFVGPEVPSAVRQIRHLQLHSPPSAQADYGFVHAAFDAKVLCAAFGVEDPMKKVNLVNDYASSPLAAAAMRRILDPSIKRGAVQSESEWVGSGGAVVAAYASTSAAANVITFALRAPVTR